MARGEGTTTRQMEAAPKGADIVGKSFVMTEFSVYKNENGDSRYMVVPGEEGLIEI